MMTKTAWIPLVPESGGTPLRAFESETFGVAVIRLDGAIRLDVCRKDLRDGITWDELQQIKHDCGYGDSDAVEFYPRDRDVFNTGNVRHLYVVGNELPLIRRNANAI